jgi:hypothetical protein
MSTTPRATPYTSVDRLLSAPRNGLGGGDIHICRGPRGAQAAVSPKERSRWHGVKAKRLLSAPRNGLGGAKKYPGPFGPGSSRGRRGGLGDGSLSLGFLFGRFRRGLRGFVAAQFPDDIREGCDHAVQPLVCIKLHRVTFRAENHSRDHIR